MFSRKLVSLTAICLLSLFGLFACLGPTKYEKEFEDYKIEETVLDDWYSILLLDTKAGYDHINITKGILDGREVIRVVEEGKILFKFEDANNNRPIANEIYGEVFLLADENTAQNEFQNEGQLLGFMYRMTVLSHKLLMEGIKSDGNILVDFSSGGGEQHIKFSADKKIYPSVALPYFAFKEANDNGLVPGKTLNYKIFMESLKIIKDVEVKVIGYDDIIIKGDKKKVFEIETSIEGYKSKSWLGMDGRVIKEITLEKFKMVMEEKEIAQNLEGAGISYEDILEIALVPSNKKIRDPEKLRMLKVKIDKFSRSPSILTGDFQAIEGPDDKSGYIFTMKRGEIDEGMPIEYGSFPKEVVEYLLPSIDIESDHKLIIAKAEKISKGLDPVADSKEILKWVNKNVKKKMVDATSALDALNTLEGECESHAYLLAGLLRARGIPTKVISGIVYSEELDGFFFHAWNEVYLGKWIPVDPTFGQFPADPTHIKFSEGGRKSLLDIISLIGTIKVDVLEMTRD